MVSTKRACVISCIILLLAGLSLSAAQPVITGVSIPDGSMKIGDVVPVTINVQSDVTEFTMNASTIGGYTLSGLSKVSDTTYTAQFTINSGGSDFAAGDDIPTNVTLADGALTDIWSTAISQANDPIDANAPTVAITDDEPGAANIAGGAVVYTFDFSETVSGFTSGDIVVANGTKGAFTPVSGAQFTLVVTPDADFEGDMTVDVAADVATDPLGNPNAAATQSVQYVDTLAPYVTAIDLDGDNPTNAGSVTYSVSFSEEVSDIEIGDFALALTGVSGSVSAVTDSTAISITVAVGSIAGDGTLGLNFDAGALDSVVDQEGNPATASFTGETVTIDNTAPSVTVNIVDDALNDGDNSSVVTFEFSEPVQDFTLGDADEAGGTLSSFVAVDADSYTAIFTATDGTDTTGSVTVYAGTYTDPASNNGAEGSDTVDIDTENPTISQIIRDDVNPTNAAQVSVEVDFSESVDGVSIGNFTLIPTADQAGASIDSVFTVGPAGVWIIRLNTVDDATGTLALDLDKNLSGITDTSGNELLVGRSADEVYDVDRLDPTVTVNIVDTQLSDTDASSIVTFEFDEDVVGFTIDDLTPTNGSLGSFTAVDANSYTVVFTATDGVDGTGSVTVGTGYTDTLGNTGTPGSDNVDIDRENPTVTVNIVDTLLTDADNSSMVTFEFSESVQSFTIDDLTPNNGTLSAFSAIDADSYTVVFAADDGIEATGSVQVASSYTDLVGNLGGTGSGMVAIDTLNPTVTGITANDTWITDEDTPGDGTFTLRITFSEPMNQSMRPTLLFDQNLAATLTLDSPPGVWTSATTYEADYDTADGDQYAEDVRVDVEDAVDANGNPMQDYAPGSKTFDVDTENPTVTVGFEDALLTDADNQSLVTITFSESVDQFTIDDLTPTNGTVATLTQVNLVTYTVVFTATDGVDGTGTVTVDATYADQRENPGTTGSGNVDIDTENPTVLAVDADTAVLYEGGLVQRIAVTFSEAMLADGSAEPSIWFDAGTFTSQSDGAWSVGNTVWTETFDLADNDEEFADVWVDVTGTKDAVGNDQQNYTADPQGEFDIDTVKPSVSTVDVSDLVITDADAGGTFTVTVSFDEDMDTGITPTLVFGSGLNLDSTLSLSGSQWNNPRNFEATYDVSDADVDHDAVSVDVTGAFDKAGNGQENYGPETEFQIDTVNPTVTGVSFAPSLVDDADAESGGGIDNFSVSLTFSEFMDETEGPNISFSPDVSSTLTENPPPNWFSDAVTVLYHVSDANVDIDSVILGNVTGCYDLHGNPMEAYSTPDPANDWFEIDTENPQATVTTSHTTIASGSPIYEGALVLTVTVTYNEPMNTADTPTISIENGGTNWGAQSGTGWSGNTVYTATFTHSGTQEEIANAFARVTDASGAHDAPAGNDDLGDDSPFFDIDTQKPTAAITLSHILIADANVGETFTVTLDYDETMNTGIAPSVVYDPGLGTTLAPETAEWTDFDTYTLTYTILDGGVTVNNDDVQVSGGRDPAGNLQNPANRNDLMIDTENPVISGESVIGGAVDGACNRVVTFSATVTDPNGTMNSSDITITSATETTGRAEYSAVYDVVRLDPSQATATISGKMDVHDLTSCPAVARVVFDAVDHVGNVAVQALDTDTVYDNTPPVIDPLAVDDDIAVTVECCVTPAPVTFAATVTDNCCLDAANVFVTVELAEPNATLEYIPATDLTITQVNDRTVTVAGSAIVRCLTGCPARVVVTVDATDCCGNFQTRESTDTEGRVYDRTAPEPLPDPYGYDDPGVRTLGRRDSDLLEVRFDDAAPADESPYRLVVRENTPVRIHVLANDDDNCTRKWETSPCQCCGTLWIHDITTPPEFGVVAIVDGSSACTDPSSIRYLPNTGYIGRDKFSYRPVDACGNLGPETWVYLEVVAAVLPEDVFLNTCQNEPIGVEILASDVFINHLAPEEIPFAFSIYDGFDHGILIGSLTDLAFEPPSTEEDPDTGEEVTSFDAAEYAKLHLQYVPAAGYAGRDGLEVSFGDPWGMSETISVEVWVSDSCGQTDTAFRAQRGETVTILLPDGYAAIHDTPEGSASLICGASATGIGEHGQVSWNGAANRYVLMLNTEGMTEGECRLLIPIGNEEYVDLRFEVGEAR